MRFTTSFKAFFYLFLFLNQFLHATPADEGLSGDDLIFNNMLIETKFIVTKEKTDDGQHFFINSNKPKQCPELYDEYQAFLSWKKKLKELAKMPQTLPPCECLSSSCRIDITSVIPQKIVKYDVFGHECKADGPNCWGAALATNHHINSFQYADNTLFTDVLNLSMCRERSVDEKPLPGDIIAIRHVIYSLLFQKTYEEVHGAIYISDDLVFSKNGRSKERSYGFYSRNHVFNSYEVFDKICYHQKTDAVDSNCSNYATYFDCNAKPYQESFTYFGPQYRKAAKVAKLFERHFFLNTLFNPERALNILKEIMESVEPSFFYSLFMESEVERKERVRLGNYVDSIGCSLDVLINPTKHLF